MINTVTMGYLELAIYCIVAFTGGSMIAILCVLPDFRKDLFYYLDDGIAQLKTPKQYFKEKRQWERYKADPLHNIDYGYPLGETFMKKSDNILYRNNN